MVGVVLVFSDVTEQYRVQVALQESEDRYRTVVELIPEAIAVHRRAKVIYVNPAAIRMFGASSPQDLVGKSILDMVHPDDHALALSRLALFTDPGVVAPLVEERCLRLDGSPFNVEVQSRFR
jgi:PAS domain S-box-containing protein